MRTKIAFALFILLVIAGLALPVFARSTATRQTSLPVTPAQAGVSRPTVRVERSRDTKTCPVRVIDGDTLVICGEHIRLLGMDAPETAGHCAVERRCVGGNPKASTASLAQAAKGRPIIITRTGKDHYGRTLALVSAGGQDLSCWQISQRQAVYVAKWDADGRVKRVCGF